MKHPQSKAKTAYGLLSEIRRLILAEPKRYDQTDTLFMNGRDSRLACKMDPNRGYPKCGTVGCVAGWVVALKTNPSTVATGGVLGTAARILQIDKILADQLFGGSMVAGKPQTTQHALGGARHIAAFQKAHAAQLKAKRV